MQSIVHSIAKLHMYLVASVAVTVLPPVAQAARWYDPMSGRFLQRDPIGIDGGMNVYAYVGSQPNMYVDPEGTVSSLHDPRTVLLQIETQIDMCGSATIRMGGGGGKRVIVKHIIRAPVRAGQRETVTLVGRVAKTGETWQHHMDFAPEIVSKAAPAGNRHELALALSGVPILFIIVLLRIRRNHQASRGRPGCREDDAI